MSLKKITLIGVCLALACGAFASTAEAQTKKIKGTVVALQTNHGTIQITLNRVKAPITTANFLRYVKSGHYNKTIFHRVMSNFMIQGGGFTTTYKKKRTRAAIQNEAKNGLKNKRGTIAMARTTNPHTASAQFFINVKDNPNLDHPTSWGNGWGYAVFGKVTKGLTVVDKIRYVKVRRRGSHAHSPRSHVVIQKAWIVK